MGDRIWWPSGPSGGTRIIEETLPDEQATRPTPVA
jgi:hypothetical protein